MWANGAGRRARRSPRLHAALVGPDLQDVFVLAQHRIATDMFCTSAGKKGDYKNLMQEMKAKQTMREEHRKLSSQLAECKDKHAREKLKALIERTSVFTDRFIGYPWSVESSLSYAPSECEALEVFL